MSKFKFNDWDKSLMALGARRERLRIRRAQAKAIALVRRTHGDIGHLSAAMAAIDAATRKKGKRK